MDQTDRDAHFCAALSEEARLSGGDARASVSECHSVISNLVGEDASKGPTSSPLRRRAQSGD